MGQEMQTGRMRSAGAAKPDAGARGMGPAFIVAGFGDWWNDD